MTHTNTLIDRLVQALGKEGVIVADAIEPRYRKDWSGVPPGEPIALLRPRSTEEVSAALAICHEFNTPVVAQGGLTGLAGAAVPAAGQIALTLERMSGVEEVDCAAATLTALAGTPIQVVQEAARDQGFLFALDWGARGSAVVGGGLSTNAGGNRVIRYGMAREHVLGLEVVLADGTVLPMLNKMQKNNSGYDLKQLFIGSEGTLGIITRAVLRLQPQSAAPCTALCSVAGFDAAVKLLRLAQRRLVGAVGAFEAMWPDYYRAATSYGKVRAPLGEAPFYVLTDMVTADPGVDGERFQAMLEEAMDQGLVLDAAIAQSEADTASFWALRDATPEIMSHLSPMLAFDVSIPIGRIGEAVERMRGELEARWPGQDGLYFGHIGDSNLHLIYSLADDRESTALEAETLVYRVVSEYRGAISAEHGIGTLKRPFLSLSRSASEIALMRTLKQALDPCGILNPGKVI
ncbi:MAG: FAD-binding oxidoreductase [Zoogloeaceae bacterium]|nr:FAD-binding oxidoreductase [Rhodocyclaceae bacterium]MCP5231610.1 FAD-binding oxidoreductase [Zoogloeaceae bacterium]MCP5254823.1 FAD-binding oxidoreductase [Zoogloeaceae bacterium]MCP5294455.1 FAD-binding oxidoreductase [Zoogloeaceae bacterium]MCW5613551.1 FAD-binding oxidoreductase [Rhodocyclaceae bacterium]